MKKTLITLAALAAASVASAAEQALTLAPVALHYDPVWADSFEFEFMLSEHEVSNLVGSTTMIAAYWGDSETAKGAAQGANAFTLTTTSVNTEAGTGVFTLTAVNGMLNNALNEVAYSQSTVDSGAVTLKLDTVYILKSTLNTDVEGAHIVSVWEKDAEAATFTLDSINTKINGGGSSAIVGNTMGSYFNETFAVPEPTTATLSLLALAGLAARRRRK